MEVVWQICCLLVFFLTGMVGSFTFDLFLSLMALLRFKGVAKLICELIFAFFIFLMVSSVLFFMTQGEVRSIFLITIGIGALCYFTLFSKRVRTPLYRFFRGFFVFLNRSTKSIGGFFSAIGLILVWPFRLIYKFIVYILSIIQYILNRTRYIFRR